MGGGLESHWVGRVYGADGARHNSHRTHGLPSGSLHQVGISYYFMKKMQGQTTLK